jgi:hypothetical protein
MTNEKVEGLEFTRLEKIGDSILIEERPIQ